MNRSLTVPEMSLARWMLENGEPEARGFLLQLGAAEITPWRCPCGCASVQFQISGNVPAPPGVHVLGDFLFGSNAELSGVFIYESGGLLSGIEVYGLGGDAPKHLPSEAMLRPFGAYDGGTEP